MQASTLGALEALLEFLRTPEVSIAVSGINIGPVRPLCLPMLLPRRLAEHSWRLLLLLRHGGAGPPPCCGRISAHATSGAKPAIVLMCMQVLK